MFEFVDEYDPIFHSFQTNEVRDMRLKMLVLG